MKLIIVSPQKTYQHDIAWVEVTTPQGNFIIQHGHAPLVASLQEHSSIIFRLENGKHESIIVRRGVIEITRTTIRAIISQEQTPS